MSAADQRRIHALHALRVIEELANVSQGQLESQALNIKRLLEGFEFFQELPTTVRERLPSVVHLVSDRKKGEALFEEGDAPDRCYILLSGSVSVYKKDEALDAGNEQTPGEVRLLSEAKLPENSASEASTRCHSRRPSMGSCCAEEMRQPHLTSSEMPHTSSKGDVAGMVVDLSKEQVKCRRSSWRRISVQQVLAIQEQQHHFGNKVATLQAGALVGELALLEDKLRSATIVCEEDCDFLVIERADFEAVLKSDLAKNREDRLHFMREHLPGFRFLPEHKENKVYYRFRKETFSKGHVFVVQGDPVKCQAFLVVDGFLEVRHALSHGEGFGKQDNQVISTIMPGGLFGSVNQQGDELFTVVAKTQCHVLFVGGRGLKGLPLTISHRMDEHLRQLSQSRVHRRLSPSDVSTPSSCTYVNTPSSCTSRKNISLMTKQAAAKHHARARSTSTARQAALTASADRTNLVACGRLQVADLLCEMKRGESATPPRSRPGTASRPSRSEPIRSDEKARTKSDSWSSSPASTRCPSNSSSRPSTAGSAWSTARSVQSRPCSANSLLSASSAGSLISRPSSASSSLPWIKDAGLGKASQRTISLGGIKRSCSQPAKFR